MNHDAWFEQAESDLKAAQILSDASYHSQAVWLAAQSVEKAHKASEPRQRDIQTLFRGPPVAQLRS